MYELNGFVLNLLINWFSLMKVKDFLVVFVVVLVWNEVLFIILELLFVKSVGFLFFNILVEVDVNMEIVFYLFEIIVVWVEKNDVDLSY